ncbi:hypothetical protein Ahy_B06g081924 [Arachis hypogaea]|uniref:Alpha-1,3-glucosyltransferase n=1 Tax=Arachis hypogaea TaxID=3818 RepID=A0A444YMB8_ARAHY|nr:hypothetical protein Ahy_B06g081924 [Arachis hypogaea]
MEITINLRIQELYRKLNHKTTNEVGSVIILFIDTLSICPYNYIILGFTIGVVAGVISRKDLVASVLYCLALNHKQLLYIVYTMYGQWSYRIAQTCPGGIVTKKFGVCMSAYFAPAFFSHLLGKGLRHKHSLLEVSKLRFYVLGNFVDVLSCLAPFKRGIFKDYVANFWCASSIIIKWKRLFTLESLRLLSLIAIVITCLPLMFQQIKSPNNRGFLCGLLNCSFAFYWFSFQVYLIMNPPEKYHFLFEAIIMNVCFSQFVLVTLGCNIKQWVLNKPTKLEVDKKFI